MSRRVDRALRRDNHSPGLVDQGGIVVRAARGEIAHLVPPEMAVQLRYLVARLQVNEATGVPRRLAMTSVVDGEGVTVVTRSLAAVLANDLGRSVCVVDLNWWSPSDQDYARTPGKGVADVLAGTDVAEVVTETSIPGLSFLPAGDAPPSRFAALARSTEMSHMLDRLSEQFDHLILDVPALSLTSDSLTLARLSDATALVIRQGVTADAMIRSALDELRSIVLLGIVLNRFRTRTPRWVSNLISA
jgi:Mrp family chromosome partitioning ATPase